MRADSRWVLVFAAGVLLSSALYAQEPEGPPSMGQVVISSPGEGPGPGAGVVAFAGGPFGGGIQLLGFGGMGEGKVVTGAPFSAVAVGETKQTLADGTNITRKTQSNLYRDAQGRFRKEVSLSVFGPPAAANVPKSLVIIRDPVAGTGYILDPAQKIAGKMPQGDKGFGPPGMAEHIRVQSDDEANLKKESLGKQTIDGVSVQGTRYTRTIPAGQIGNDRPLTIVKEEWYSPDLQLVIQSKHTDPFQGETTYTLTNIQRTAPDASLFSVPSDYTVKEGPMFGRAEKHGFIKKGEAPPPPPEAPGPGFDM